MTNAIATSDRMRARSGPLGLLYRIVFWPMVGLCAVPLIAFLAAEEQRPILYPLLVVVVAAAWFFTIAIHRENGSAPVRAGTFYGAIVALYAAFPLLLFLLNGMVYNEYDDNRLFVAQPTPEQIGTIAWWYVAYLLPYFVVYLLVTPRLGSLRIILPSRTGTLLFVTLALYVAIQVYLFALHRVFGLRAQSYYDVYTMLRSLPLFLQQITGRLQSWIAMLQIVLLVIFFKDYRRNRIFILLLIGSVAVSTMMKMHARTELFLLLVVAGFLYHHMVRRFSVRMVAVAGVGMVLAFTALGALRNLRGESDLAFETVFRGTNEFQAILSNGYDLFFTLRANGVFLENPALYFGDFLLVIPSQLLPFTKQTAALWYMQTYHPLIYEAGGGLAFGAIAESVVGFGMVEAVVRGALLALVFGMADRFFSSRPVSLWFGAYYVWLAAATYHSFRSTSFAFITYSVQLFLVPAVLLWLAAWLISRIRTPVRPRVAAPAGKS